MTGERLLRWAVRLVPPDRRTWAEALLAELPTVPDGRRRQWLRGGIWLLTTSIARRVVVYGGITALFATALGLIDRSTSDVANQITLLMLLIFSATLGALRPRLAWLTAVLLGGAIATARTVAQLLGAAPADPQSPHTYPAIATLLVLIVPAAVAACTGAILGRRLQRSSHTGQRESL